MTPWDRIEKRIHAAATADFVTAVYNPKSEGRYWQLYRLKEIFLKEREAETPVGFVRQAGRKEETVTITTLQEFDPEQVDMFTVVLIGNSQSYYREGEINHSAWLLPGKDHRCDRNRSGNYDKQFPYY